MKILHALLAASIGIVTCAALDLDTCDSGHLENSEQCLDNTVIISKSPDTAAVSQSVKHTVVNLVEIKTTVSSHPTKQSRSTTLPTRDLAETLDAPLFDDRNKGCHAPCARSMDCNCGRCMNGHCGYDQREAGAYDPVDATRPGLFIGGQQLGGSEGNDLAILFEA